MIVSGGWPPNNAAILARGKAEMGSGIFGGVPGLLPNWRKAKKLSHLRPERRKVGAAAIRRKSWGSESWQQSRDTTEFSLKAARRPAPPAPPPPPPTCHPAF